MENRQQIEKLAYEYQTEGLEKFRDNELGQAAILMRNAVELFRESGNEEAEAESLNYQGVFYSSLGNESIAMDCFLEGLEKALEKNYASIAIRIYNNIGSRYQDLDAHLRAIEYFHKAEAMLEYPQVRRADNFPSWAVVTYLNLTISHCGNGDLDMAEWYLNKTKGYFTPESKEAYGFTVLVNELLLLWKMKKEAEVRSRIGELSSDSIQTFYKSDYVQNMRLICDLFESMQEYGMWENLIKTFETFAKKQNDLYHDLTVVEMWMEYHKSKGDIEKYNELCIRYVELEKKRKIQETQERAEAIDIKIELQAKELERQKAEEKSNTDRLTGLFNRYRMETDCEKLIDMCRMYNKRIVVGIIDLDCFKEVNDTYGHVNGDEYLRVVADILRSSLEDAGQVYRFGGDEFVVLMSDQPMDRVEAFAKQVKSELHERAIENINSTVVPELTLSQGYTVFNSLRKTDTFDSLLKEADYALYQVKRNGRNDYRVIDNERR